MTRITSLMLAALVLIAPAWVYGDSSVPLYQFNPALTDQANRSIHFDVYKGHPTIVTMFYGSCPNVCPLLIETLRQTEQELNAKQRDSLRALLISIDPERDTPAALGELAKSRRVDTKRWSIAAAQPRDVRKLAAILNIQYRKLPNGEFNHSTVITLLDASGKPVATTSKLGAVDAEFVAALKALL